MGCCLIALLAFTSDKFYSATGWIVSVALICWEGWNALSSFQSFSRSVPSKNTIGAIALGLFSGLLISLPGFAGVMVLKASFGNVAGSLIAIATALPFILIISVIFDKAYLKSVQ
jgi:hypothetical protein